MAGMFGIGGGNIIVPLLTLALHYPAEEGHRHLARGHPLSLRHPRRALLLPAPGISISERRPGSPGAFFVGTVFGARITISLPTRTVKLLYGFFLLFVAARFFF